MANLSTPILKLLRERHAQVVARRLGLEAGADGQLITTNPYSGQTDLAFDWLDGHAEGCGTIPKSTHPVGL